MNPKLHLALLIILVILYAIWFWLISKRIKPRKTKYITVDDISFFKKGEEFELLLTIHPDTKPSKIQKFKVLRLYPKTNKIKVKEIT